MKTDIGYILAEKKPRTNVYMVFAKSSGIRLGEIRWSFAWQQYCFFPDQGTVWSEGCLNEIADFIEKFMDEREAENNG